MSFVTTRALVHLKALKAREAEYAEDCAQWHREGYRPHYCIHGTNLWVDYDNICGPCEDGLSVYEIALIRGHNDDFEFRRRLAVVGAAIESSMPQSLRDALIDWGTAVDTF